MHRQIGVFVGNVHKYVTDGQKNVELFPALADKCLRFRFPRLDFAADKLPEQASRLVNRSLTSQKPFWSLSGIDTERKHERITRATHKNRTRESYD